MELLYKVTGIALSVPDSEAWWPHGNKCHRFDNRLRQTHRGEIERMTDPDEITTHTVADNAGGTSAELVAAIYADLRRLAAKHMVAESGPQTLSATALVHEAWLRMGAPEAPDSPAPEPTIVTGSHNAEARGPSLRDGSKQNCAAAF